jgi:hypothetical protein
VDVDKGDRLRAIEEIATIARQHGISSNEIASVMGETHEASESRWRGVLVRVLGFLGGTFVFAGIAIFIALQWDSLNSAGRVVVTFGSGTSAFALAVLSSGDARFGRATTPLFLTAAALEPTGMFVAFDEFGSGGDWRGASVVACAAVALQFGAAFRAIPRSMLLFIAMTFATLFWWTTFDLLGMNGKEVALVLGGCMLFAAVGVARTPHRDITPVWYFLGAAAFLYGFFDLVERTPFEIAFLLIAAGFVYLSTILHSRTLLAVATLAILGYTGWFTGEHFANSTGWPIALIFFGVFMIGLSAVAFRIDREYVRATPVPPRGVAP